MGVSSKSRKDSIRAAALPGKVADKEEEEEEEEEDDEDEDEDEDILPSWGSSTRRDKTGSLTASGKMSRMEELLAEQHHYSRDRDAGALASRGTASGTGSGSGRYRVSKKPPVPKFGRSGKKDPPIMPPRPPREDRRDIFRRRRGRGRGALTLEGGSASG